MQARDRRQPKVSDDAVKVLHHPFEASLGSLSPHSTRRHRMALLRQSGIDEGRALARGSGSASKRGGKGKVAPTEGWGDAGGGGGGGGARGPHRPRAGTGAGYASLFVGITVDEFRDCFWFFTAAAVACAFACFQMPHTPARLAFCRRPYAGTHQSAEAAAAAGAWLERAQAAARHGVDLARAGAERWQRQAEQMMA